jgi:serine/threonine-protein kinase
MESAPLTRAQLLLGQRLGAYEVVRLVGKGATSIVFEGRHVALGKPVAIKVLHENLSNDRQVAGRFLREGKIAAQIRHPNAIDVMDVGEERGVAYLVMELLGGRDLKSLLAERRPLPLTESIAYALPILSALAHAHDLGAPNRGTSSSRSGTTRASSRRSSTSGCRSWTGSTTRSR